MSDPAVPDPSVTYRPATIPASHHSLARALAILRIFFGLIWLSNGVAKLIDVGAYDLGFASFGLLWQGRQLRVTITADEVEYRLVSGPPMRLRHHGEPVALAEDPVTRSIPAPDYVEPVEQPFGRAPRARHPGS